MMIFHFKEDTHQYFLDGIEIPSVSSVIDHALGEFGEGIPKRNFHAVEVAKRFGKATHTGIKLALQNRLDWSTVDDAIRPCIESAVKFTDHYSIRFKLDDVEKQLYSRKHLFAGTLDLCGKMDNGYRVIVDWKTSTLMDQKRLEYQLNAYDILDIENKSRNSKCVKFAVQLLLNGGYRVYPCSDFLYKQKFLSNLKEMKEIKENGIKRNESAKYT